VLGTALSQREQGEAEIISSYIQTLAKPLFRNKDITTMDMVGTVGRMLKTQQEQRALRRPNRLGKLLDRIF
jgi:hypothetical protein